MSRDTLSDLSRSVRLRGNANHRRINATGCATQAAPAQTAATHKSAAQVLRHCRTSSPRRQLEVLDYAARVTTAKAEAPREAAGNHLRAGPVVALDVAELAYSASTVSTHADACRQKIVIHTSQLIDRSQMPAAAVQGQRIGIVDRLRPSERPVIGVLLPFQVGGGITDGAVPLVNERGRRIALIRRAPTSVLHERQHSLTDTSGGGVFGGDRRSTYEDSFGHDKELF
jgi:hypothetical protein